MSMAAVPGEVKVKLEPADIKVEPGTDGSSSKKKKRSPGRPKKMKQEKITDHMIVKPKRKIDRFKGMSEEEVLTRLLPDHLAPNLDIVIVGINPGLYAAFVGHHYAGPGNHFWKCMYLSGLIPEPMNAVQDYKLLDYGIGFTNIVARTSRGSADLKKKEIQEGAEILTKKLLELKPKIAVFNGKGIYEVFVGHKKFYFGKQPEKLPGTETAVYVMPSSSARCSQLPRAVDKVPFYEALKKLRDHLNGKLPDLAESEITFPDLELKTAKKVKKEESGEIYPGEIGLPQYPNGGNVDAANGAALLGDFVSGSYQVIPHDLSQRSVASSSELGPMLARVKQEPVEINEDRSHYQPVSKAEDMQSLPSWNQFDGVRVKQESGTTTCASTCLPPWNQFDAVRVKQEPGTTTCGSTSVSQPCQYSQVEYLGDTQRANSLQNRDSHLNSFLEGMYGLVNGVSNNDAAYGMVNNSVVSTSQPLQFNDALLNIVKDGSDPSEQGSIYQGGVPQGAVLQGSIPQSVVSQSSATQGGLSQCDMSQASKPVTSTAQPKKRAPRKRKSTDAPSSTVTSPRTESQNSQSSLSSQFSDDSQRSPTQTQESPVSSSNLNISLRSSPNTVPIYQPLQAVGHNPPPYNVYTPNFANSHPYPPFTTAPYFMGSPNFSNSYHTGADFGFQHQSFSQMLGQIGMPPSYEHPIGLTHEGAQKDQGVNGYSSQGNTNSQGQFQPNMVIKQEKPDYS